MPIPEKTVQTYLKVKALVGSPNSNEADVASKKLKAMETEYPGIAREAARSKIPVPNGADLFEFLKGAYQNINEFVDAVSESAKGMMEATAIRISRNTRGSTTFLTMTLPTATLVRVRAMNDFQRTAFKDELLRRVEVEIEDLLD